MFYCLLHLGIQILIGAMSNLWKGELKSVIELLEAASGEVVIDNVETADKDKMVYALRFAHSRNIFSTAIANVKGKGKGKGHGAGPYDGGKGKDKGKNKGASSSSSASSGSPPSLDRVDGFRLLPRTEEFLERRETQVAKQLNARGA